MVVVSGGGPQPPDESGSLLYDVSASSSPSSYGATVVVAMPQAPKEDLDIAKSTAAPGAPPLSDKHMGGVSFRIIILVVVSQFMGYSSLVSLQHKLKQRMGIADENDSRSHMFGVAVSCLYMANLIFRLMHNLIFAPFAPRNRVYVAMGAMFTSMLILGGGVFFLGWTHLAWVFVAYALGGVGIGSFESNLLSAITPLGHTTKLWATLGMPLGFSIVLVGGFGVMAAGVDPGLIYFFVGGFLLVGALIFMWAIPVCTIEGNGQSFQHFVQNLREFALWLPAIKWHCFALMLDMFFVALFSGVMLYILNGKEVPLLGPGSSLEMNHDLFFMCFNLFTMIGDNVGRTLSYRFEKPKHPIFFVLFSLVGALICLTKFAIIAPVGITLIFFCNGLVYASSTRHIDTHVDARFNLIALSVWLCVGDIGSVAGSNIVAHVRDWVCTSAHHYICSSK